MRIQREWILLMFLFSLYSGLDAQSTSSSSKPVKIAIIPFDEVGELQDKGIGRIIADIIIGQIQDSPHFECIPQQQFSHIAKQKMFAQSILDESEIEAIHKSLPTADQILVGSVHLYTVISSQVYKIQIDGKEKLVPVEQKKEYYSAYYALVSMNSRILVKDSIPCAHSWESLLKQLLASLQANGLMKCEGFYGEMISVHLRKSQKSGEYIDNIDQSIMVYIPEGPFIYTRWEGEKCVEKSIELKSFYIDQYEISYGQYFQFLEKNPDWKKGGALAVKYTDENYLQDWTDSNTVPEGKKDLPIVWISWYAANAYCAWAGKSLPTEEQWAKAARGGKTIPVWLEQKYNFQENPIPAREYPWGEKYSPKSANIDMQKMCSLPVSAFPDGISLYGCYNMVGNVAEWCARPKEYSIEPVGILKGGAWGFSIQGMKERPISYQIFCRLTRTDPQQGFRGCMVREIESGLWQK